MDTKQYDILIIGSGPTGFVAARAGAFFGKRVALIEKSPHVGGAVANTGTLPSKTLRETALALSGIRSRKLYGVDLSLRREVTIPDLMRHEHEVSDSVRTLMRDSLAKLGIELAVGAASFVDPHTLQIESPGEATRTLRGDIILIATGSSPVRPPEFPFEHDRVFDSDEILEIDRLPKSMAVVGAGVVGSEYACTFAALGVPVSVIDGRDVLLPFLDQEVSRSLVAAMQDLGIRFQWNQKVLACSAPPNGDVELSLSSGAKVSVDAVLVAAGRSSNTATLNLAAAGITPGNRGLVPVNHHYQTDVTHIYAAGDVIGFPALASTSTEQARVAMCHACGSTLKTELSPLLAYGIYTIPEVGMVGQTEEALRKENIDYIVGRATYQRNARGVIIGDERGFLKLLFRRSDMKLLGVHAMGEQATELIHVGVMGMLNENTIDVFIRTCFNFPTLGELYKQAAIDALVQTRRA
jgi:NAD(P) transhydrogenase